MKLPTRHRGYVLEPDRHQLYDRDPAAINASAVRNQARKVRLFAKVNR